MKHYQVEVEKNGCEHCGEGKMWVIVANGIAGGTSYANEDEAVELCDQLNDAFELGRASVLSCGDCDPCLGGRPDQCAVLSGQHNDKLRHSAPAETEGMKP